MILIICVDLLMMSTTGIKVIHSMCKLSNQQTMFVIEILYDIFGTRLFTVCIPQLINNSNNHRLLYAPAQFIIAILIGICAAKTTVINNIGNVNTDDITLTVILEGRSVAHIFSGLIHKFHMGCDMPAAFVIFQISYAGTLYFSEAICHGYDYLGNDVFFVINKIHIPVAGEKIDNTEGGAKVSFIIQLTKYIIVRQIVHIFSFVTIDIGIPLLRGHSLIPGLEERQIGICVLIIPQSNELVVQILCQNRAVGDLLALIIADRLI